jgi:hypothetical protein
MKALMPFFQSFVGDGEGERYPGDLPEVMNCLLSRR